MTNKTFIVRYCAVALAVVLGGCGASDEPPVDAAEPNARPIKTALIERSTATLTRNYPATVLPSQRAELSFRFAGRITELPVRAAAQVTSGDVIARLDPRDLDAELQNVTSQLDQAKAQLAAMTSGARSEDVAALEANVAAVEAEAQAARDQLSRTETLLKRGVVTRPQVDDARSQLAVVEARLQAQQEELNKGLAGSRSEEVDAQQALIRGLEAQRTAAEESRADATLRAPFDGIVAVRHVDNFANIQANEKIVTLQRLADIELGFDIPGADVSLLANRDGLQSIAQLDALPGREFEVALVEFSTEADAATQTFRARVQMKTPDDAVILPGMSGSIVVTELRADGDGGVIRVPVSAVASRPDGEPFVWVIDIDQQRAARRPVTVGELANDAVTIIDGLQGGETIATAGVSFLQEGMAVRPLADQRAAAQ